MTSENIQICINLLTTLFIPIFRTVYLLPCCHVLLLELVVLVLGGDVEGVGGGAHDADNVVGPGRVQVHDLGCVRPLSKNTNNTSSFIRNKKSNFISNRDNIWFYGSEIIFYT